MTEEASSPSYRITSPGNTHQGLPALDSDFGRVTVLLGANGTGKSKLVKSLKPKASAFGEQRPVVYVEGGRMVSLPSTLALKSATLREHATLEISKRTHHIKLQSKAADRAQDALFLLDKLGQVQKDRYIDVVTAWRERGSPGDCPRLDDLPIDKLFQAFSNVFPDIQITLKDDSKKISCLKSGSTYDLTDLSDGEKQVFCLLADVALLSEENSLVLVDEPELNLHPKLACSLWNTIEAERPKSVFVYATHSLAFTLRESVDKVIVLRGPSKNAQDMPDLSTLEQNQMEEFLGAVPAILAAKEALVVEGDDESFDTIFYKWLAGDRKGAVVAAGGCRNVYAAANRTDVWRDLAPAVRITGVIDRDFRSAENLHGMASETCKVLDYHEAESFLCEPSIIVQIASALGTGATIPSESAVVDAIHDYCNDLMLRTATERTLQRTFVALSPSVAKNLWSEPRDETFVRDALKKTAAREWAKAKKTLTDKNVLAVFEEELETCKKAIEERQWHALLEIFPGKELCCHLARMADCRDHKALARAAKKHLNIENLPRILALRNTLWPPGDATASSPPREPRENRGQGE